MASSNNPPYAIIEIQDKALYDFIINSCDANMNVALGLLQSQEQYDFAAKLVDMIEKNKSLKKAAEKGKL